MDLMMTNQGGGSSGSPLLRDNRKGNWTVQETMVLIEAKKMEEERRMKRQVGESCEGSTKPAELRWKWVEDYCWRNGCFRTQNQCNDKWDNLMRDFKKVRDFERRKNDEQQQQKVEHFSSYWKMEKSERKEKNLPSNMLPQIYEALVDVVERKGQSFFGSSGGSGGASSSSPNIITSSMLGQVACNVVPVSSSPALQKQMSFASPPPPIPPQQQPPQQQPTPPPPPIISLPFSPPLAISDSETSEYSDSPAKRRRRGKEIEGEDQRRSTTPIAVGGGTTTVSQQLDESAITKSASLIVGAIQASEEREERRHKELLKMQERRLLIEESNAEINRQGIRGLVDAINNLAHSLLAMASNKNQPTP